MYIPLRDKGIRWDRFVRGFIWLPLFPRVSCFQKLGMTGHWRVAQPKWIRICWKKSLRRCFERPLVTIRNETRQNYHHDDEKIKQTFFVCCLTTEILHLSFAFLLFVFLKLVQSDIHTAQNICASVSVFTNSVLSVDIWHLCVKGWLKKAQWGWTIILEIKTHWQFHEISSNLTFWNGRWDFTHHRDTSAMNQEHTTLKTLISPFIWLSLCSQPLWIYIYIFYTCTFLIQSFFWKVLRISLLRNSAETRCFGCLRSSHRHPHPVSLLDLGSSVDTTQRHKWHHSSGAKLQLNAGFEPWKFLHAYLQTPAGTNLTSCTNPTFFFVWFEVYHWNSENTTSAK